MIKEYVKNYCKNTILMSTILIIIAILLILNPVQALNAMTTVLGAVLIAVGLMQVLMFFKVDKEFRAFSLSLIFGIITIVIGCVFLFNPESIYNFLIVISGIWIVFESIVRLQIAMGIKDSMSKIFNFSTIIAVITLIIGIIMIVNPFAAIEAVGMVAGIALLVNEIFNVVSAVNILRNNK